MDPQFVYDYEGPVSFYQLVSRRSKKNPLLLRRLTTRAPRTRHDHEIDRDSLRTELQIHIQEKNFSRKDGRLIVGMLCLKTASNACEIVGSDDCLQSIDVNKGDDIDWRITMPVSRIYTQDKSISLSLIVIFKPNIQAKGSGSDGKGSQSIEPMNKAAMSAYVASMVSYYSEPTSKSILHCKSSSYANSVTCSYVCLLEFLPNRISKRRKTDTHRQRQYSDSFMTLLERHRYIALSGVATQATLTGKVKSFPYYAAKEHRKGDLFLEIAVKRINTVRDLTGKKRRHHSSIIESSIHSKDSQISDQNGHAKEETQTNEIDLFYHYLFYDISTDQVKSLVEQRNILSCPWCPFKVAMSHDKKVFNVSDPATESTSSSSIKSHSLSALGQQYSALLINHLNASHYHFSYIPLVDSARGSLHIVSRRDHSFDQTSDELMKEHIQPFYFKSDNRTRLNQLQAIEIPNIHKNRSTDADPKDGDIIEEEKESKVLRLRRLPAEIITGVRQYYHARLGLPVMENSISLSYDSDHEIDQTATVLARNKALDEFEDVSVEEKEFMKLWNTHMQTRSISYADSYVCMDCEDFVLNFGKAVLEKNLRHNFALHLINMWDFGLLKGDDIQRLLGMIDRILL